MGMSYGILKDEYLPEEKKRLYVSVLELLYTSGFEEAYEIIRTWSEQEQTDFAIEEAFESEDISIICFVEFLISKENSYFHHRLAVDVLNARCWYEGAYSAALFHAKEMFRLNPCIEAQEAILFYYDVHELELVHITRNVRISKRIFRRTRKKFADVLYVRQEFLTKLCGKFAERRALSGNVNTL